MGDLSGRELLRAFLLLSVVSAVVSLSWAAVVLAWLFGLVHVFAVTAAALATIELVDRTIG